MDLNTGLEHEDLLVLQYDVVPLGALHNKDLPGCCIAPDILTYSLLSAFLYLEAEFLQRECIGCNHLRPAPYARFTRIPNHP